MKKEAKGSRRKTFNSTQASFQNPRMFASSVPHLPAGQFLKIRVVWPAAVAGGEGAAAAVPADGVPSLSIHQGTEVWRRFAKPD